MSESLIPRPTDVLSYDEFTARFSAASLTLAREGGVDDQTKAQLNGVLDSLRIENPGHLQTLQQRMELDLDN